MTTTSRTIARPFFDPQSEELRFLPEGPRLLHNHPGATRSRPLLGWVAIQHSAAAERGSINILDLASRANTSHALPGRPGFFAETTRPGVVLIGLERRIVLYNLLTGALEETGIAVPENPRVIINDGLAVEGGVFFGTKHLDFNQPVAALYFLDLRDSTRPPQLHQVAPGQTCSNGKHFVPEPDGGTLIDIDTIPKKVSRYRLDQSRHRILSQSLVVEPGALPSMPDGLRPTPDGDGIVIAFYNPNPVPDGLATQIDLATGLTRHEWILPGSPRVTCPEFIELDGAVKALFTTAVEGMDPALRAQHAPHAGVLYIADTPFTRLPPPPPLLKWGEL